MNTGILPFDLLVVDYAKLTRMTSSLNREVWGASSRKARISQGKRLIVLPGVSLDDCGGSGWVRRQELGHEGQWWRREIP